MTRPLNPVLSVVKGLGGIAAAIPLLQFNYETSVTYGDDGFSTLEVKGTLEIPLTRTPNQRIRTLTETADNARVVIEARVMADIDLSRFRVVRRNFNLVRDKRTLDWDFSIEEKPYMDLPYDCTVARGSYSVRPAHAGMGLCLWLCTLRATYTVRADRPRRIAWLSFLALLRERMASSTLGNVPDLAAGNQAPRRGPLEVAFKIATPLGAIELFNQLFKRQEKKVKSAQKAWLIDFSFDEGLYLDSKTSSFSATWRMVTTFSHVLLASGLWTKLPEKDDQNNNLWATSMRDVQGVQSWLTNRVDPKLDVIVDFGS